MKRLLVQTQLSNYDAQGKFILECDSGWQMVMGRVRQMLKLCPDLHIDVMGPVTGDSDPDGQGQLITDPQVLNRDLFEVHGDRLRYMPHWIEPNALATRYNFDIDYMDSVLHLKRHRSDAKLHYDAVYINDPMHLRNFRALFMLRAGYKPKFFVHSHFIDNPSCPKFPEEASLWLGQCEAAIRADFNFWQCESAMNVFFQEMSSWFTRDIVKKVVEKSAPWDDGYSSEEVNAPIDERKLRFDPKQFVRWRTEGKHVIFVPNRVGGRGRSSDYTNCGKFLFELLPELARRRRDFVVLAGNPNQKFSNGELQQECSPNGYVSLVPDAFNRDEFKFVARNSQIAVGLYDQDSYGGTVARECVDLGCLPLWINNFEYASLAREAGCDHYVLAKPDFSDLVDTAEVLMNDLTAYPTKPKSYVAALQRVVKKRCSYEETTPTALKKMGFLGQ